MIYMIEIVQEVVYLAHTSAESREEAEKRVRYGICEEVTPVEYRELQITVLGASSDG